jgi:hypothetical protein
MPRLSIRKEVLRDLAIRSKNQCAFPGCSRPLLNERGVYVSELCHIEAAEPGGERYNLESSDEARRSPGNLVFLCHEHHIETNDVARFTVDQMREIKRAHEALPEVVFNADLLLQRINEVAAEQAVVRQMIQGSSQESSNGTYQIIGPELEERWTPDRGRFYESKTGERTKFKYMMRDGWLHVEQTLGDGAIAYYEVNESGSVRNSRMPYPINEYRVVIPSELILSTEKISSSLGTHAIKTTLKWSKGSVTEHFVGNTFAGADCNARCAVNHESKTISVLQ